jgi:two-component system, cell cycle response regulator DivK
MALILVVEDSELQAVMIQRALERDGHRVVVLLESRELLQVVHEVQPDLIIMDIDMPHFSGVDLIKMLKSSPQFSAIPIIIFTALSIESIEKQAREAGSDAYLIKPMSLLHFREYIQQFLQDYYGE